MPNMTENLLSVSGTSTALAQFVDRARSSTRDLDFSAFVPALSDDEDDRSPDGAEVERDVPDAVDAWGTKWNAMNAHRVGDPADAAVHYYFETAWSPPLAWLTAVATSQPGLKFELIFVEPMMAFAGLRILANGALTRDIDSEESVVLEAYGRRRFDLLRAALENPTVVQRAAPPAPRQERPWAELWGQDAVQTLLAAAAAAGAAKPTPTVEAKFEDLARAYEECGEGTFAGFALRAAGHENEAVARFVAQAEESERLGFLSAAAMALSHAGKVNEGWAMAKRSLETSIRPPFTP